MVVVCWVARDGGVVGWVVDIRYSIFDTPFGDPLE